VITLEKDPVCGMEISKSSLKSLYKGKTYYFCSVNCKKRFDQNPELFLKEGPKGME
jgi:Uncharacterized conserved protein